MKAGLDVYGKVCTMADDTPTFWWSVDQLKQLCSCWEQCLYDLTASRFGQAESHKKTYFNEVSYVALSVSHLQPHSMYSTSCLHVSYIPYKCYILREFSLAFAQLYPIGGHYYWWSIGTEFLSLHLLFLPLEVLPKGCHHR